MIVIYNIRTRCATDLRNMEMPFFMCFRGICPQGEVMILAWET